MKLEPHHRVKDQDTESKLLEILRELNDVGCTINYSKVYGFYKYQADVDSETTQYRVAITYPYRSALQLELISNNLNTILSELIAWKVTV